MLEIMRDEELVHAQKLMDTCRAQCGEHIPFLQRQDVKGFLRRKPVWLAKVLSVQQVRKEVKLMELESMRFYRTAAKRTTNLSVRKLLDKLAVAEQVHEDLAGELDRELEESGARKKVKPTGECLFSRLFNRVLQGSWMDLSRPVCLSSRRPLPRGTVGVTFLVGMAAPIGAGISMGFAEALSDDGVLSGADAPSFGG